MARYYSIKEIAERIEVPEYTLRYWINTLGFTGKKRHNRIYFDERGMGYFIGVKSLLKKGYNLSSIKSLVKEEGRSILLKFADRTLSEEIVEDVKSAINTVKKMKDILKEARNVH